MRRVVWKYIRESKIKLRLLKRNSIVVITPLKRPKPVFRRLKLIFRRQRPILLFTLCALPLQARFYRSIYLPAVLHRPVY